MKVLPNELADVRILSCPPAHVLQIHRGVRILFRLYHLKRVLIIEPDLQLSFSP